MSDLRAAIVDSPAEVLRIAERAARAPRLAIDVEANGLFAYRPRLCTVQIAWEDDGAIEVAIIDTLRTSIEPLRSAFGAEGPIKVLHDLTFDAKLLEDAGAPLANVRDTSVSARFLGFAATGLATLVASELGQKHDKAFQQHDWAARPITDPQRVYLAADVAHLFALDDALTLKARARGIEEEIADECAYKLATIGRPPRDLRPPYARIKGARGLDAIGRAVLRRLVLARESIAESRDVPPFKVISNDVLLDLAAKRPLEARDIRAVRAASRSAEAWARAIAEGVKDGAIPEEDAVHFRNEAVDRVEVAKRRAIEGRVSAFRKREAKAREIDEQALLPGHCAQDLGRALFDHGDDDAALRRAIRAIPGLGVKRLALYEDAFVTLAVEPAPPAPVEEEAR